jgi:hypothetical protein
MAGPALAHVYRYQRASSLRGPELTLATSGGAEAHPHFFVGGLAEPALAAQALWTLSRVVQSRYHVPAAMLQKILILADPVVTSGAELLRFEGFSSCASVYTRVDLLPDAFTSRDVARPGTTNVDFNAEMRAALARVRSGDRLGLSVGHGEVVLEADHGPVIERKVPLPLRWLKGFVEVQAYQAAMRPRLELRGPEAARFLRSLPRTKTGKHASWIVPSGASIRLSQRASSDAVRVTAWSACARWRSWRSRRGRCACTRTTTPAPARGFWISVDCASCWCSAPRCGAASRAKGRRSRRSRSVTTEPWPAPTPRSGGARRCARRS